MAITRRNGKLVVYKAGPKREFDWCVARVERGTMYVLFQNPVWKIAMRVAIGISQGEVNEFIQETAR